MMKQLVSIILFLLPATLLFAQQEKSYVKKGNELYRQQQYKEAESNYRKSVEKKNQNVPGNFNLGDALYKQKKYAEAAEQFTKIAGSANKDKAMVAQAYHNLGNSLVANKKLEEGINAYKQALINNPQDDETRYNLAYAQEMLKKQQQQNKKNQKPKDNKDQQKKDQKDQDKKKDDPNKDKKDQDKNNPDKNKGDKPRDDQQKGQQPQPDKLSKEDAQRMLDALNNNEKETQDKLKNKKLKGEKVRITKDW